MHMQYQMHDIDCSGNKVEVHVVDSFRTLQSGLLDCMASDPKLINKCTLYRL